MKDGERKQAIIDYVSMHVYATAVRDQITLTIILKQGIICCLAILLDWDWHV